MYNNALKRKDYFKKLTMLPFGGMVGVVTYLMYFFLNKYLPLILLMGLGCIMITGLELLGGYVLNIKLKLGIWNYSNYRVTLFGKEFPIHFLSQINILHSLGWFGISLPLFLLGSYLL
jgi:uncharacterized membrane protein